MHVHVQHDVRLSANILKLVTVFVLWDIHSFFSHKNKIDIKYNTKYNTKHNSLEFTNTFRELNFTVSTNSIKLVYYCGKLNSALSQNQILAC